MELVVAGLQAAGVPGGVEASRAQLRAAAVEAAAAGAGLLITPELLLTGYDIGDQTRKFVGGGRRFLSSPQRAFDRPTDAPKANEESRSTSRIQ